MPAHQSPWSLGPKPLLFLESGSKPMTSARSPHCGMILIFNKCTNSSCSILPDALIDQLSSHLSQLALPRLWFSGVMPKSEEPQSKRPKVDVAAASSAAIGAATASGAQKPTRPEANAPKAKWQEYHRILMRYVLDNVALGLKSAGMDITKSCLWHLPPAAIEKNNEPAIGGAKVTTFRERWVVANCETSMNTAGKYEAAGVLWWFLLLGGDEVKFKGEVLFTSEADPVVVEAAGCLWDDAAFKASDNNPHQRHFSFPGSYPTACAGVADVQQTVKVPKSTTETAPTFKDLPLLAGRHVVLAYLEALFDAMEARDGGRLKKLFEAMGIISLIGNLFTFLWAGLMRVRHSMLDKTNVCFFFQERISPIRQHVFFRRGRLLRQFARNRSMNMLASTCFLDGQ
jgi:hypothetical protein